MLDIPRNQLDELKAVLAPLIRAYGIAEAERQAGITPSALRAWLSGHRGLSWRHLLRVADLLGYDVEIRLRHISSGRLLARKDVNDE